MVRRLLQQSVPVVAVILIAFAASGRAQNEKAADSGAVPGLATLLAGDFAYTQPDKAKPVYRVTVESKGEAFVVIASENVASWKYPDGSPVKYAGLFGTISPWYPKDVKPPVALLTKMSSDNDRNIFVHYSICTNEQTGEWALFANAHLFLKGASKEVLTDYLFLVLDSVQNGKKNYLPFMKAE